MNPKKEPQNVNPNVGDDGIDYSDFIVEIPKDYIIWPAKEHNNWEDLDVSERLMKDPSYIDRM